MRKILVTFCLLLLVCHPAAADPVTILGAGQVELAQNIVVTQGHDKKGKTIYDFRAKDGMVWRGATLMPIDNFSSNAIGNMLKKDIVLNNMINGIAAKSNTVLATENAQRIVLGDKECFTGTIKLSIPGTGLVANMDFLLIPGTDGEKMFGFICADSDAQYWRPIMQKIASNIP